MKKSIYHTTNNTKVAPHIGNIALLILLSFSSELIAETQIRKTDSSPIYIGDPDIYVHSDNYAYLTGTAQPNNIECSGGREICIYKSSLSQITNQNTWSFAGKYNPNIDDAFDYCNVWAPSINYINNNWYITFTARRVANGEVCGTVINGKWVDTRNETYSSIYVASGSSLQNIGKPRLYPISPISEQYDGISTTVRSWNGTVNSCPPAKNAPPPVERDANCMRIDSDVTVSDGITWIPYVWYHGSSNGDTRYSWQLTGGNSISIFNFSNPSTQVKSVQVACDTTRCFNYEEAVNEGPNLFKSQATGYYYLFYATGTFDNHYAVRYLKANNVLSLERKGFEARPILLFPHYDRCGNVVENHGGAHAVDVNNTTYLIYHKHPISYKYTSPTSCILDSNVKDNPDHTAKFTVWIEGPLQFDVNRDPYPFRHLLTGAKPASVVNKHLRRVNTNNCMDNPNGSWTAPFQLRQYACASGVDAQRFDIIRINQGNGQEHIGPYYMLRNRTSGYCVDIENNSTTAGSRIVQYHCHGANNQLWEPINSSGQVSWDSTFKLRSVNNPQICINIDASGNLVTGYCTNSSLPQWIWENS